MPVDGVADRVVVPMDGGVDMIVVPEAGGRCFYVTCKQPRNVKQFVLIDDAGTAITYRCMDCGNYSECKKTVQLESISIQEEIEQTVIERMVKVDTLRVVKSVSDCSCMVNLWCDRMSEAPSWRDVGTLIYGVNSGGVQAGCGSAMTARFVSTGCPRAREVMDCEIDIGGSWNKWGDSVVDRLDIES